MLYPELKDLVKLKQAISYSDLVFEKTANRTQGDYASLFHGLGVEFETVRPYVVGDDVRYIDWRVTARSGKPHVKTFRAESDRDVLIVVDANAYMRFGTRTTFKSIQAAKTTALLCWKSLQQQDRVGGLIFGDVATGLQYFKPAKTDSSVLRMLKSLCNKQLNVHAPVGLSAALTYLARVVSPQTLVFIVSDFSMEPLDNIQKSLLALRKECKIVLLPIHDAADRDIPPIGTITFADNSHRMQIDTNDAVARKKYRVLWDNYLKNLLQLGKKLKAHILCIDTTDDLLKVLFANPGSKATCKS